MGSRTLTANIRRRRKSKVTINLPLYIDKHTPRPFVDPTIPWHRNVFPEDAGALLGFTHRDANAGVLTHIDPSRGEEWFRAYRPYLHGCDGLRYGLLLSSADLPVLQHRAVAPYV